MDSCVRDLGFAQRLEEPRRAMDTFSHLASLADLAFANHGNLLGRSENRESWVTFEILGGPASGELAGTTQALLAVNNRIPT